MSQKLRTVHDIVGAKSYREFAVIIGKGRQAPNVNAYLNGGKIPQKRVLLTAVQHAFEWRIEPLFEIMPLSKVLTELPEEPGIYALYDSAGQTVYVGQAKNVRQEVNQTLNRKVNFPVRRGPKLSSKERPKYGEIVQYVSAYKVPSARVRHNLEALILRLFPNQTHNNKMGSFR